MLKEAGYIGVGAGAFVGGIAVAGGIGHGSRNLIEHNAEGVEDHIHEGGVLDYQIIEDVLIGGAEVMLAASLVGVFYSIGSAIFEDR